MREWGFYTQEYEEAAALYVLMVANGSLPLFRKVISVLPFLVMV